MKNILNRLKEYFLSKDGNFVNSILTIVGVILAVVGLIFAVIPFFGDDELVVPEKVVQTVLKSHQQQLLPICKNQNLQN